MPNWIDFALLALLVLFVVTGAAKGAIRQLLHVVAIAAALGVAALLGPAVARLGPFDALRERSQDAPLGLAYLGIFLVMVTGLLLISGRVAERFRDASISGTGLDQTLGGVLGGLKGILLLGGLCIGLLSWQAAARFEPLRASTIARRLAAGCEIMVLLVPEPTRAHVRAFAREASERVEDALDDERILADPPPRR